MSAYVTRGRDSSGRPIRMSQEYAAVYDQVCDVLGFTPVITQGGFMGELAAELSGPTHDGDALDLRVWNLTARQVQDVIRVLRAHGVAAWLRNLEHGGFKDAHIHAVPGRWAHPSSSALRQWEACRNGRDGLASNGPDYHPYPLAKTPPEDDMYTAEDRERDQKAAAQIQVTHDRVANLQRVEKLRFQIDQATDAKQVADLKAQLAKVQATLDEIKG